MGSNLAVTETICAATSFRQKKQTVEKLHRYAMGSPFLLEVWFSSGCLILCTKGCSSPLSFRHKTGWPECQRGGDKWARTSLFPDPPPLHPPALLSPLASSNQLASPGQEHEKQFHVVLLGCSKCLQNTGRGTGNEAWDLTLFRCLSQATHSTRPHTTDGTAKAHQSLANGTKDTRQGKGVSPLVSHSTL